MIAKILANRLIKVMSKLVKITQNAFVEGRQISNVSLITNEVIDTILKKNGRGVLCKLNIEKVYDYWVNWNYLLQVMQRMGFGGK